MANVIQVLNELGGQPVVNNVPLTVPVKSGTSASILPGYLVIVDGSNAGYGKAAPDATDSTSKILGIANSTSTETASADGTVTIDAASLMVVKLKAKTPASLTAAMKFTNRYTLDVTSGNYTLDQGTTSNGIFTLISFDNTTDGNCIATLATGY